MEFKAIIQSEASHEVRNCESMLPKAEPQEIIEALESQPWFSWTLIPRLPKTKSIRQEDTAQWHKGYSEWDANKERGRK